MYPKKIVELKTHVDKYIRLVHQCMVMAACPVEFLHFYISEYCRQITPFPRPFCSIRDPAYGIKAVNVVSRLIPVVRNPSSLK